MAGSRPHVLTRRQFTTRMVAAGASAGILGPLLSSCGGGDDSSSDGGGPIQFWKFVAEGDDPQIEAAIERWNAENADMQVEFQTFPFADYTGTKLTTAFAAGNGPDVFWISPGAFLNYVNTGVSAPVDDLVDKGGYNPASVAAVTVDGAMQALPFEIEPVALFYREDHLADAGLEPPTTWDGLFSAAQELTSGDRKGIIIEVAPGPYQNFTWYPFLWSAGGEVVNEDSTESALRSPEAAAAFDLWGRLVTEGYAPNDNATSTTDIGTLGRGETSMQVCGFWAIAALQEEFADQPINVIPIPAPDGGSPVSVYGGWTQMLNAESPRLDAAKAFTKWLWVDDDVFAEEWACRAGSKFSPREAVNEACADVFGAATHSVFADQILPIARAEPRYPDQVVKAVGDGLQAAMFRGASGEEAAALAADAIDTFLSSYQGAPLNPETT
ncbi:ABC transporter substrate-binding protein [Jiangella mangrovi]|uniref:Multiple sugar transport system substrate-binding protein n=1 Tax=Jiangella mangrovi TaxID=1524084 RepID=A0A7W9GLZ0_9ACTN|nr:sugar ABC transporter substrate-binding protein [Jiangella mangrovi]MBB5786303.1 multiple sugar transport system substrate-binding protein [Jiangella mangrovi]